MIRCSSVEFNIIRPEVARQGPDRAPRNSGRMPGIPHGATHPAGGQAHHPPTKSPPAPPFSTRGPAEGKTFLVAAGRLRTAYIAGNANAHHLTHASHWMENRAGARPCEGEARSQGRCWSRETAGDTSFGLSVGAGSSFVETAPAQPRRPKEGGQPAAVERRDGA